MTRIIWSCHNCGTVLPLWKMKCSNCHKLALSWFHVVVVAGVALPALLLTLKFL